MSHRAGAWNLSPVLCNSSCALACGALSLAFFFYCLGFCYCLLFCLVFYVLEAGTLYVALAGYARATRLFLPLVPSFPSSGSSGLQALPGTQLQVPGIGSPCS